MDAPEREDLPKLVTTRPDAEIAADLKAQFAEAIQPALAVLNDAQRQGLRVQFDGVGMSPITFRYEVNGLRVIKIIA